MTGNLCCYNRATATLPPALDLNLAIVSYRLTVEIALVSSEKSNFQFILRLLNTNVDGKQKIMYALTKIKGVGRRYSNLVCKKADVDLNKRWVAAVAGADSHSSYWVVRVRSHRRSLNGLSPSSKTQPSTRFLRGSSTDSEISSMARIVRFWRTTWRANFVRIWNG